MHTRTKLLLAGLAATLLLSFAVSNASARRIAGNGERIYLIWNSLEFRGTVFGAQVVVRCPVTLLGSFHSKTISKVSGRLIGYISHATVHEASCVGGTGRALTERLPWHIQYVSFAGTLPAISEVRLSLVGATFQITASGVSCLYTTTQARPAFGRATVEARGNITGVAAEGSIGGAPFPCPEPGRFEGTASARINEENSGVSANLRLVQ